MLAGRAPRRVGGGCAVKKRTVVIGAISAAVLVAGGVIVWWSGGDPPPAETVAVRKEPISATVSATGNVVPMQQFNLDIPNPGRLVEVDVKQGDQVGPGQVLAKIDSRPAEDDLAKANAALDDANFQLRTEGSTPSTRLAVTDAVADLHAAQRALDDTVIVSPTTALVTAVRNRPGELVGGGSSTTASAPNDNT